jgi:hypothetical protein
MAKKIVDGDEELSPEQERIVRRMRLFVVMSTGIMVVGLLLVMSVIAWRLVKQDAPVTAAASGELQSVLPIGKGQRITDTTSDGERLFVTVEGEDGRQSILVFDAASLAYRGKIESLAPAP